VWLFAESRIGESWVPPVAGIQYPLGQLSFFDFVFIGLFVVSGASTVNEFIKSRDNTRSTAKPNLLTGNTTMVLEQPSVVVTDPPPPAS
jgi:cytochrome P450